MTHVPQREIAGIFWAQREIQVMKAITENKSNKEIAAALGISLSTTKWWVGRILRKLRLDDGISGSPKRVQVAVWALRNRVIPLLVLLSCLLFAISARAAAPTIVQNSPNTCFGTSVSSLNCSLTSNVTAGNFLLVCIGTAFSRTINTPTMTGETFTKITGMSNGGSSAQGQEACYATNSAAGGQKQVSESISGGADDIHILIVEVHGQSASPQDATGNTNSTTCSVSTSVSTTNANDLVIAFFYDNANNRTIAAGSGYSTVQQTNNTTGGDVGYSESKTVSATGTQTATCSGNSGDNLAQGIIAIAGTSGGGSTCTPTLTVMGVGRC